MRELTENEKRKKAVLLWREATELLHNAYTKADSTSRLMSNKTQLVLEKTALALDFIEEAMALGLSEYVDEDVSKKEEEREARRKEREELKAHKYPIGDIRNCIKVKCTEDEGEANT